MKRTLLALLLLFPVGLLAQDAEIKDLTLDASPLSTDNLIVQKAAGGRAVRTTRGTLRSGLSGTGTCTNQVVTVLNSDAAPTCSSISDAFITDGTITEADLKVVDSPADEECFTFESTTGDFEWQTCGGGSSSNSFATIDAPDGTDPVADSATDTLDLDAGWGVTITGSSAADSLTIARRLPEDFIELVEDFLGGTTTAGSVGSTGLSGYGAVPARSAAIAGHPGVYRMTTPATSGAVRGIGFGAVGSSTILMANEVERFLAVIRPIQNTSIEIRCGIGADVANTAYGTDAAYFEFDDGVGTFWRTITTASSVSTTNTTSVAMAANTWYKLEVVRTTGGNFEFWLDGTLVFTHSTNQPTAAVNVGCAVESNAAAAVDLDADLYLLTAVVAR